VIATPSWDRDYLRKVVDRPKREVVDQLAAGVSQMARAVLLLSLAMVAWRLTTTLWAARHLRPLGHDHIAVLLWLWGASLLLVELVSIMMRDSLSLPWMGQPPRGTRILLRALAGFPVLFFVVLAGGPSWIGPCLQLGTAIMLFGWNVPQALRSWRSARAALASLRSLGAPASPALIAREPGRHGRRVVRGRLAAGPGIALAEDGVLARLDPSIDAIHLDDQRGPLCAIARVHVDDTGYRSAGVRLEPDGLPVWILSADRVEARLRGFRRRLRLISVLDGALIGTAGFGLAAVVALIVGLLVRG
jgi:hypothetical protein